METTILGFRALGLKEGLGLEKGLGFRTQGLGSGVC